MKLATLSFDDGGWQDEYIANVLRECGISATFYLCSKLIDRLHFYRFDSGIRELYEGFEIGCHSATHPDFRKLPSAQWRDEIGDARKALSDFFGQPVECFAWPFGAVHPRAYRMLRDSGFIAARSIKVVPNAVAGTTDKFSQPISGVFERGFPIQKLLEIPAVHLVGHACAIRDRRLEKDLGAIVQLFLGSGFSFVTNSTFFRSLCSISV